MRAVAGAEPPVVVPGVGQRDAAQVGADPQADEVLGVRGAVGVGLGVAELPQGHRLRRIDVLWVDEARKHRKQTA